MTLKAYSVILLASYYKNIINSMKYLLHSRVGILSILARMPLITTLYHNKELFTVRVKTALAGIGSKKSPEAIDELHEFLFAPLDLAADYDSASDSTTHKNLREIITVLRFLLRQHYADTQPEVDADLKRFADRAHLLQNIDSGKMPLTVGMGAGASAASSAPSNIKQRVKNILKYDILESEEEINALIKNAEQLITSTVAPPPD